MLGSGGDVKGNVVEFQEWILETGEFVVGVGGGDVKTTGFVEQVDLLEAGEDLWEEMSGLYMLDCNKM